MARARILIERGDTLTRVIDWDESDGDPISLAGYVVTCNFTVGAIAYDLTETSGLTVSDSNGRVTVVLTKEQTALFEEAFGEWRLYVTSVSGVGTTLAEGLAFVSL
jgi:hypothetical protein